MTLNVKVALLLLGLLAGGVAGWVTRPEVAEIRLGSTAIDFQNNQMSTRSVSDFTKNPSQRVLVFALAGGVIGLLAGFAADMRR